MEPGEVDSLGEVYDFGSIMHYARNTFSRLACDDSFCFLLFFPRVSFALKGLQGFHPFSVPERADFVFSSTLVHINRPLHSSTGTVTGSMSCLRADLLSIWLFTLSTLPVYLIWQHSAHQPDFLTKPSSPPPHFWPQSVTKLLQISENWGFKWPNIELLRVSVWSKPPSLPLISCCIISRPAVCPFVPLC